MRFLFSLLNEAREKTEAIIDALYHVHLRLKKKPRTYRKRARKQYLAVAKQRKPHAKTIRKVIGKQLGYVGRNLKTINRLLGLEGHGALSKRQTKNLEIICTLYLQQRTMYTLRNHQMDDRIVSISHRILV